MQGPRGLAARNHPRYAGRTADARDRPGTSRRDRAQAVSGHHRPFGERGFWHIHLSGAAQVSGLAEFARQVAAFAS